MLLIFSFEFSLTFITSTSTSMICVVVGSVTIAIIANLPSFSVKYFFLEIGQCFMTIMIMTIFFVLSICYFTASNYFSLSQHACKFDTCSLNVI